MRTDLSLGLRGSGRDLGQRSGMSPEVSSLKSLVQVEADHAVVTGVDRG
jgi:hypothetical protein